MYMYTYMYMYMYMYIYIHIPFGNQTWQLNPRWAFKWEHHKLGHFPDWDATRCGEASEGPVTSQ